MTDDEKKEFEEFLQWKKEKLEKEKLEQQSKEQNEQLQNSDIRRKPDQFVNTSREYKHQQIYPKDIEEPNHKIDRVITIGVIVLICIGAFLVFNRGHHGSNGNEIVDTKQSVQDSIFNARADSIDMALKAKKDSAKASADSIRKAKRIELLKHSLRITTAHLSSPNSAGGVDAIMYYKNLSSKTIKYFYWEGYAKNAVGDVVENEIGGDRSFGGKDTGPIKFGKTGGGCWSCIIYNWTAKKLVVTDVTIEYMDGTELRISENEIKYVVK